MTRPKRVKVGSMTYPVQWVRDIESPEDGQVCLGYIHMTSPACIRVADASPDKAETLLHEILHALFDDRAIGDAIGHESEEFVVNTFSRGLIAVLRENKGLAQFLIGGSE